MSGFKNKTIEKIIKMKINNWLNSIKDKNLQNLIRHNYIITGGAITSLLLGEMPNDYDVYFSNSAVATKVAEYYTAGKDNIKINSSDDRVRIMIKSTGVIEDEDSSENTYELYKKTNKKYSPIMITDNAISLTDDIQIIIRFIGSPSEIHKNYDFVHTTNYFTENDGLVLNFPAVRATMSKELKYVGSLYPICSLFRLRKFINRGWSITAGEILKISFDISKLDLTDPVVLEEQLVGVDQTYFRIIIGEINKMNSEEIDRSYIVNLIDRVFEDIEDTTANNIIDKLVEE